VHRRFRAFGPVWWNSRRLSRSSIASIAISRLSIARLIAALASSSFRLFVVSCKAENAFARSSSPVDITTPLGLILTVRSCINCQGTGKVACYLRLWKIVELTTLYAR
jgi:hypothetical protein